MISFCESHHIDVPGMNDRYMKGTMCSCQQKDYVTVEYYYRIDFFNVVIYFQLTKLNNRFTYQTMKLLTLSSALNPVDSFKSFNVDDICNLAERFYPRDFTQFEILKFEKTVRIFSDWCVSSCWVSVYFFAFWIMSKISWDKKASNLLLDKQIDSFSVDSSYFDCNDWTSIFRYETYQDTTPK